MELGVLADIPRIEFGYRLHLLGLRVRDACILMRDGNIVVWLWQVWGDPVATPLAHQQVLPGIISRRYARDDHASHVRGLLVKP